jgi:ATP-dependent Clp protease ATP-binding subunit ClpC
MRHGRGMASRHIVCAGASASIVLCLLLSACTLWRMNEDARRAVFLARYEAGERGATAIDTEHLLLGVIRSDPGLARAIAAQAGYEEGALLRRLDELSPRQPKPVAQSAEMPMTERSSRVLSVAQRQLSVDITPADLLVALISVDGVASQVLRELGVTEGLVRGRASGGTASAHQG